MLVCLVPAEMEVRVKFLEIFKPAYKHSGVQLGGLFSQYAKSL